MTEIELLKKTAPEVFESYINTIKALQKRCPFDDKVKEFILIAILTAKESEGGLNTHIQRAIKAGANEEEILTVIISALPSCGIGSVMKGIRIAKKYFE